MTPQQIAEQLGRTGLCICPDFLSATALRGARADFDSLADQGSFQRANIGKGKNRQIQDQHRSDEIYWLDQPGSTSAQSMLWKRVESLKLVFNQSLFLGISSLEGHYAVYPQGGFYRRHRDAFKSDDSRTVSLIIYLNQDWLPADGGQLRIYDPDGSHQNVEPVGGTMVCFLSRESEHEVLPCRRPRRSFAGWFKRSASPSQLRSPPPAT